MSIHYFNNTAAFQPPVSRGNAPSENYGPRCIPVQRTYENGIAEGERRATERIVAWLREMTTTGTPLTRVYLDQVLESLADRIERGEHRREEKP